MLNRFIHLPLAKKAAAISAMLATLACLILVLASYHGNKQLVQHSATLFGKSLIQQLSREASNPLVQNDKLSLQALLNELVNTPIVTHAVIYDVENHPMAEAGEHQSGVSLSASITFQDSLAGYALITLNSQSLNKQATVLAWQLAGLAALLVALIYLLSLLPARLVSALLADLTVLASRTQSSTSLRVGYRGDDELQALAQQLLHGPNREQQRSPEPQPYAILALDITALPSAQASRTQYHASNQHSAVNEWLADCHNQLTIICKLYDGQLSVSGPCQYSARFYPTDKEDSYPFRALCSGYLIQQWINNRKQAYPMTIGLALKSGTLKDELEELFAEQRALHQAANAGTTGSNSLTITDELFKHPSVATRVDAHVIINSKNEPLHAVDGFHEPYQQLLERQWNTLSIQLETR